jgi:ribose 5-phosphate isomerase B
MIETKMRIGIGSDHGGFKLKQSVIGRLVKRNSLLVRDYGTHSAGRCDYPDFAFTVADAVAAGRLDRGILICTSGWLWPPTGSRRSGR